MAECSPDDPRKTFPREAGAFAPCRNSISLDGFIRRAVSQISAPQSAHGPNGSTRPTAAKGREHAMQTRAGCQQRSRCPPPHIRLKSGAARAGLEDPRAGGSLVVAACTPVGSADRSLTGPASDRLLFTSGAQHSISALKYLRSDAWPHHHHQRLLEALTRAPTVTHRADVTRSRSCPGLFLPFGFTSKCLTTSSTTRYLIGAMGHGRVRPVFGQLFCSTVE